MKRWRGFTLIEVSLFLAITGLIFLGIAIGVQNSIFQQRANDAVQSFAEFLRKVYSGVNNVQSYNTQSLNSGRTEKAIYGKLVTFGERKNFAGEDNDYAVFSYNVIGDISDGIGDDTLSSLNQLNASVANEGQLVGLAESFLPKWQSVIQGQDYTPYVGALLIVRHPATGNVLTFVMEGETVQVNAATTGGLINSNPLKNYLNSSKFKIKQVDYCLNPNGDTDSGRRFDIRVIKNAKNSSGIEVVSQENEGYACEAS